MVQVRSPLMMMEYAIGLRLTVGELFGLLVL
jgi:hypothetical protein